MPLVTTPTAPVKLTPPQQAVAAMSQAATQMFAIQVGSPGLLQQWIAAIKSVWKNQSGATPQQVVAEMGTGAVANFQASALTTTYLTQTAPLVCDAATNTAVQAAIADTVALIKPYTVNGDGTITVNPPS